jgi:imidazolonepropionase-like amidohydrolase
LLAIASLLVCGLAAEPAVATLSAPAPAPLSRTLAPPASFTCPQDAKADGGKADGKSVDANAGEKKTPALAIRAAKVYVRPDKVLEGVTVLVQDGRILAIGADLATPADARKLDAKVVTAGFIDSWSSFALDPTSFGDERTTPSSAALDAVDPYVDPRWEREILRAGVTSYRLQPSPAARIAGLGAIMRLHPGRLLSDSTILGDCALALTLGAGRAGSDVFERAAESERVLGAISEGWAYLEEKNEYKHELAEWEKKIAEKQKELDDGFKKAKKDREKAQGDAKEKGVEFKEKEYKEDKKPKAPRFDEDKEILARAANGEMPLVVEVHSSAQIRALLDASKEFKRARLVLCGASDAHFFAKELAERRIPVLLSPQPLGFARPAALANASLGLAAELEEAGVEVLIGSGGQAGLASRDLSLLAALAIGHGLSPQAALAALTTRPARVFDVAGRVGSVEVGRDADLVLFDGEPFAATTKVKYVISGGDLVVEE